jgi:hypothetical protein
MPYEWVDEFEIDENRAPDGLIIHPPHTNIAYIPEDLRYRHRVHPGPEICGSWWIEEPPCDEPPAEIIQTIRDYFRDYPDLYYCHILMNELDVKVYTRQVERGRHLETLVPVDVQIGTEFGRLMEECHGKIQSATDQAEEWLRQSQYHVKMYNKYLPVEVHTICILLFFSARLPFPSDLLRLLWKFLTPHVKR